MKVTFENFDSDYLPYYRRRPGEITALPAFLRFDLLNGTAAFAYGDDAEIVDAENRGELVCFPFDPRVRGCFLPTIVRRVLPLLQIVQNGYRGTAVDDDDDNCLCAVFDEVGQAAVKKINDWLDDLIYKDSFVIADIWEASDYVRDRVAHGHEINEETTDDQLERLEVEYEDDAHDEGIHIVGDLLAELIRLRDWLRETAAPNSRPTESPDVEP